MKNLLCLLCGTYLLFHFTAGAYADNLVLVAGGGSDKDNVPATKAKLNGPFGVDFDKRGNMYVVEMMGQRIVRVDTKGILTNFGGTGQKGDSGDGGSVSKAAFSDPHNLIISRSGILFLADTGNGRIRTINPTSGDITLLAGTGKKGYSGDGGPALKAEFSGIYSLALDVSETKLYLADLENRRIRVIDMKTRIVNPFAGNGQKGVPSDGTNAKDAPLVDPRAVAVDRQGNVYILERSGHALRVVDPMGKIRTIAGTGKPGLGLGDPKTTQFNNAKHLCIDLQDNVIIADSGNHRIVKYAPKEGKFTLIAGTGKKGESANGGPALETAMNEPHGVFVHPNGILYIADSGNQRVFRLEK
jgi:NHL repeat